MNEDWLKEVAETDVSVIPTEEKLSRLAGLAQQMRDGEETIAELEERLSNLKRDHRVLTEVTIPGVMQEVGVREFKLTNGLKLSYKFFASGKILDLKLFDWMEEQGFADVVKAELVIKSRRTDRDILTPVYDVLAQMGIDFAEKESIHYQTLSAWIKEQIEAGGSLPPPELLEVFRGFKANLK